MKEATSSENKKFWVERWNGPEERVELLLTKHVTIRCQATLPLDTLVVHETQLESERSFSASHKLIACLRIRKRKLAINQ